MENLRDGIVLEMLKLEIKIFDLEYLEEAYTTEHWIVRIYKVKGLENRG